MRSSIMSSSSTSLRRRLHHGDVDGRRREHYYDSGSNSLNEPLLGNDDDHPDGKLFPQKGHIWDDDDEKIRVQLHWSILFSQIIEQWAHWLRMLANLVGSGSIIGRLFASSSSNQTAQKILYLPSLSPLQEERLRKLQRRLQIPFDGTCLEHQDALKQLWRLAYPDREIPPLKSELWKEMGWQGTDPSTDFRGGGFISLENLIYFADKYPASFQRLLHKTDGARAEWEYPFAVAGVNISFVLAQMLDLQSGRRRKNGSTFEETKKTKTTSLRKQSHSQELGPGLDRVLDRVVVKIVVPSRVTITEKNSAQNSTEFWTELSSQFSFQPELTLQRTTRPRTRPSSGPSCWLRQQVPRRSFVG